MMNRSKTQKDIRSRIKHENVRLGAGTEMGGMPNNFGLNSNAFQPQPPSQSQPPTHPQAQRYNGQAQQQQQQATQYSDGYAGPSGYGGTQHGGDPIMHPAVAQHHQPHPLGAGPSFVSLSPSDSISNFEGRAGNYSHGSSAGVSIGGQLFEPSAGSTASFAQNLGESNHSAHVPLRPARSVRRPQRMSVMSSASGMAPPSRDGQAGYGQSAAPVGRNILLRPERSTGGGGASHDSAMGSDTTHVAADRHAKSARLMAQVNMPDSGRETPASGLSEEEGDGFGGGSDGLLSGHKASNDLSPTPISPPLGSLTQEDRPAALSTVLSALSQAGRRQGQARILRGTTAEEESRRRRIERKVEAARSRESRPLESYVDRADETAFREIGAVLRKAKAEWDFLVDDDFNSVSLAFSLLDDSSLGSSRHSFEDMKVLIERALQGTVDDHYESFATAISLHNNVLGSLTTAQGGVSGARRRLRDAREALGAKRADLVQLWHRSQGVKESLRLLDAIDNLKGVPDRLESLMAEKQFLEAVNLLTRALKISEKVEILEVGATSDLRAYLKGQEHAMFDILIEELHNHLYLKSYFCDARWKSYTPGQTMLPNVEFGRDPEESSEKRSVEVNDGEDQEIAANAQPKVTGDKSLKLFRYLESLRTRPAPDANMAAEMPDLSLQQSTMNGDVGSMMTRSMSADTMSGTTANNESNYHQQNPETDSFLYIEMLLEALAKLGKLKLTQEIILQRLPTELHQLVDATIDEVAARSEMLRRSSVAVVRPESLLLASSSALARSFAENARNSFRSSFTGALGHMSLGGSAMRLTSLESSQVERDCETMRDLFWTLFSKLDAVLQGHRVMFEVVAKISSRGASSAYKAVKVGKPSSLTDIWRPIQTEVRTLLHEHLVDESEGTSARRNAIISVNEVLRQGNFQRDRSKALFRLVPDFAPKPGVSLSRKDYAPLKGHEEALTNALRASVPGLVGTADGSGNSAIFQHQQQRAITQQARTGFAEGAGHKLLVKPDAFNISVLFRPALAFIERVKLLLPPEAAGRGEGETLPSSGTGGAPSSGFSRFLDEFVRDVFLSQLEDKVQSLFATAVGGPDAFQEDAMHKSRTLGRPIVRSVANVIVLIDSLYAMLRTTPFHRESYSLLIIQTTVQYYQRCYDRFRDLVTHDATAHPGPGAETRSAPTSLAPTNVLSAMWAQRPEIASCLAEMINDDCSVERKTQLMELENALELQLANTLRVSKASPDDGSKSGTIALRDLTTSRKKLTALGNLHHSLLWFHDHISKLKATDQDTGGVSTAPVARLSLVAGSLQPGLSKEEEETMEEQLRLPLSADMVPRFQTLPNTYKHLAHLVLFTLRLEVRARTIHHIDLAINEGNYLVEDAVLEPDPHIVDLNAELASLDDIFDDTILPQYHRFLFSGLASLMDTQLCRSIRKIRFINRHGLTKMIRNIMALQQNLRNIVVVNETISGAGHRSTSTFGNDQSKEANAKVAVPFSTTAANDGFDRSRKLWELVGKEPDELLAAIRTSGPQHAFEDYHSALNLMLGLENGPGNAATTPATPAGQGPLPPGAHLRPGTSDQPREVSRQKINEYLIELHEVAGEAI